MTLTKKYYYESVGECVSQVYKVEANNWEEAKKEAFDDMTEGDILAECLASAIIQNAEYPDYYSIDKDQCTEYAMLNKGTWANREPSGTEYWESRAWFFDDDPETYYNSKFEEFYDWEQKEEEE